MNTFEHMELNTDDPEAAKRFYSEVFGWTFQGFPMGEAGTYWMATAPGAERALGGIQN
jgi:predicted enzyme related to lactoylglutathione lyase